MSCKYNKIVQMLLKDSITVPLNPPMKKILCSSVAFNNSVVLIRMDKPSQEETIVHLDKNGKILLEHKYMDIIDNFGMMNEREVIVLNIKESKIDIISLTEKDPKDETKPLVRHVNHDYAFKSTASTFIFCFSETKLLCVGQYGDSNDNRLILSYYQYQSLKEDSKPVARYESKDNEWTYEHSFTKMNNHSKIGWYAYKPDKNVSFTYCKVVEKGGSQDHYLGTVTTKSAIGQQYGIDFTFSISYVWEIKPDVYMMVTNSNKNDNPQKCRNKDGIVNNNYIVDASHDEGQATMKETKFSFEKKDDIEFNNQLIDCFGIGNTSVFHTFKHKDGKKQRSPVYYVNNQAEQIVLKDEWLAIVYQARFFFPGWDGNCVVQTEHTNGDCDNIIVNTKKACDPKDVSMFLLLGFYDDFEDDLLQDAVELLSK